MPRAPDTRLNLIIEYLRAAPDGATLGELDGYLGGNIPLRTLQRWLTRLRQNGTIATLGAHRFTRYVLAVTPPATVVCPYAARPDRAPLCPYANPAAHPAAARPSVSGLARPAAPSPAFRPATAPNRYSPPPTAPAIDPALITFEKQMVPKIVRRSSPRDIATIDLNNAAAWVHPGNYDAALELINHVLAVLDALTPAKAAKYDLSPTQYHNWRVRW